MAWSLGPLTSYRNWVLDGGRGVRIGLVVAVFVLMGVLGQAIDTLQETIGVLPTRILLWIALLLALYTLYTVVRSVVSDPRT